MTNLDPFSYSIVKGQHRNILSGSVVVFKQLDVEAEVALQGEGQGWVGVNTVAA